jgi:Tol biopolymer transport system component
VDSVVPRHGGAADYHIARDGSLIYVPTRPAPANSLVWVDAEQGTTTAISQDRRLYSSPRLSPDGKRLAVVARSREGTFEIWIYDLANGGRKRLGTEADSMNPVWTPDGTRITFASTKTGPSNLYWVAADGSSLPEALLKSEFGLYPASWSPKGLLAYQEMNTAGGQDLWVFSPDRGASRVAGTSYSERLPRFSPDGRWLAYTSTEPDGDQTYVEPFPGTGSRWQISPGGGREPIWAADGRAIYYRSRQGDQVFKVTLSLGPVFSVGRPSLLFQGPYEKAPPAGAASNYDVSSDGRRFVMIKRDQQLAPQQIVLVVNWLEEVKRRAPLMP